VRYGFDASEGAHQNPYKGGRWYTRCESQFFILFVFSLISIFLFMVVAWMAPGTEPSFPPSPHPHSVNIYFKMLLLYTECLRGEEFDEKSGWRDISSSIL